MDCQLLKRYDNVVHNLNVKIFNLKKETKDKKRQKQQITIDVLNSLTELEYSMNQLKKRVPHYKNLQWRRHTDRTHPLRNLPSYLSKEYSFPCCTQAFCKFYEILMSFPYLCSEAVTSANFSSLHLCEAPGAFVVALAIYLKLHVSEVHWSWRANSLNPYYEWNEPTNMILDDTLIAKSYAKWLFGPDNSGNIFNWTQNYLDYIVCKTGKFHLITADGSFNCQDDPENQEKNTLPLFKKAIQIALDLLRPNGSFVIKMYTIYRKETVETIFDLFTSFERLYMFKPSSSKPGNPEVYLICESYLPMKKIYDEMEINQFWTVIYNCAYFFSKYQREMIEFNLDLFQNGLTNWLEQRIKQKKNFVCENFMKRMKLASRSSLIEPEFLIWGKSLLETPWNFKTMQSLSALSADITDIDLINIAGQIVFMAIRDQQIGSFNYKLERCWQSCCSWLNSFNNPLEFMKNGFILGKTSYNGLSHSLFTEPQIFAVCNALKMNLVDFLDVRSQRISNTSKSNFCVEEYRNKDGQSFIRIMSDQIDSEMDWIEMLRRFCKFLHNGFVIKSVEICSPSGIFLVLTRFSFSFVSFCSLFFENVVLRYEPDCDQFKTLLHCSEPRQEVLSLEVIDQFLSSFYMIIEDDCMEIMQFVPFDQLLCEKLYSSIYDFNHSLLLQVLFKFTSDLW